MNRFVPLLLAAIVVGGPAFAQAPQPAGALEVYAFDVDGLPRGGLTVVAGDQRAHTGGDGVARIPLPAGHYEVRILDGERELATIGLPVAWGEVSEILVELSAEGSPTIEVEAPGLPKVQDLPQDPDTPTEVDVELGTLSGRLVDVRDQRPVPNGRVLVRGHIQEAVSDAAGAFRLQLPVGTHTLSVIHPDYATLTQGEVAVRRAGSTITLSLTPATVELDAVRVTGYQLQGGLAALLEERRGEEAVGEVLGAEQIAKSGDGDAAEALRRVTGLTVVGGRYVFVRGMGQRYSSALLNGATLPSPQPEQRVVPLDLFPTGILESIAVQKAYSPELPGEFGGGAVLLRTKGIPEEFFANASFETSFNDRTTGKRGLTYDGASSDWLTFDNGERALPYHVRTAADAQPLTVQDPLTGEGYPPEVLEAISERIDNEWTPEGFTVPPNASFSASVGDRYEIAEGRPIGYRAAIGYKNSYQLKEGVQRTFGLGGGGLVPVTDYRSTQLTRSLSWSSLVSVGYEFATGHQLEVGGLWLRLATDDTETYQGFLADDGTDIRVHSLQWVEESLLSGQVRGTHELWKDGIELTWRYTYARAERYSPDWRRHRYDFDVANNEFLLSNRPDGNQRLFNEINDDNHDAAFGLTLPLVMEDDLEVKLGGGVAYVFRDRESETRRFKFVERGPLSGDPAVLRRPAEEIFTPEFIGPGGFLLEEITRNTDSYAASQRILAGYVKLDLLIAEQLKLSIGARVEDSRQEVETFDLFSRGAVAQNAELDETDILPAVNATWRFRKDMQVRAGYSRTLSRPDFRELSTAPYDRILGAGTFIGNPELDRTLIDNLDLRWEFFPTSDELISVGVFYKQLHDPIETVVLGGSNRVITLANADSGTNVGLELEFRKRLGFLGAHPFFDDLVLAGNLALIDSEVELSSRGIATEENRPLQGQSRYVINLSIGYDDPDTQRSIALLYNVSGKRISEIGTLGLPDVYEQPIHQIDLVARWGLNDVWSIRAKVENILGEKVRFTQGSGTVREYEKGRTYSFGLQAKF